MLLSKNICVVKNSHPASTLARSPSMSFERFSLSGETVVIVDDVVTTGATVSTCVKAVKMLGAKQIICVSVAKTFERTNNIARS